MGKQIEQMEQSPQQQPQLLFYNDSTSQTGPPGPPFFVDLFIEAGKVVFFFYLVCF